MAYYMTCDINGCCSLKLNATDKQTAIDEGYDRVKEAYQGPTDLDDACNVDTSAMTYADACDAYESAGATCVSRCDQSDGVDIWVK